MTTPTAYAPLYAARPFGVQAIAYAPSEPETLRTLAALRPFDLAIVPADNRYSWLARALGARWIVAFGGDRPGYKSWPIDELRAYPRSPGAWGDIATQLVDGDPPPPYDPKQWPAPPVRSFDRPAGDYVVLHVGASTPLKLWPADRWRMLAHELTQRAIRVVWSGGPGEQPIIDAIDPHKEHPSYAGQLDLVQLWHLLAHARCLICPDTGVAHLGRIVGVPTVCLFGPGSHVLSGAGEYWRYSPYWPVTVHPFPCRDQTLVFKRPLPWVERCYRSPRQCTDNRCMQAIDLAMVRSALDRALATTRSYV